MSKFESTELWNDWVTWVGTTAAIAAALVLGGCYAPEQHFEVHSAAWEMANPPYTGKINTSHSILVGILDGGIDYNHPFLANNIHTFSTPESSGRSFGIGYDTLGNDFFPHFRIIDPKSLNDMSKDLDIQDHATHVAGLVALKNAKIGILPIKVLPIWMTELEDKAQTSVFRQAAQMGHRSVEMISTGIQFGYEQGARLFNMSLGMSIEGLFDDDRIKLYQHIQDAIASPMEKEWSDALFVVAAGNEHEELMRPTQAIPATLEQPNVMAVGALKDHHTLSYYSNYGRFVDIYVRGSDVTSSVPTELNSIGNRAKMSGSSMAAPLVAHTVAELKLIEPDLTGDDLRAILLNTAEVREVNVEPLPDSKEPMTRKIRVRVLNPLKAKQETRKLKQMGPRMREKLLKVPFQHGHAI